LPTEAYPEHPYLAAWESAHEDAASRYGVVEINRIERALNAALPNPMNGAAKTKLVNLVVDQAAIYLFEKKNAGSRPKHKKILNQLRKVSSRCRGLAKAVAELDEVSMFFLIRSLEDDKTSINVEHPMLLEMDRTISGGFHNIQSSFESIDRLDRAVVEALDELPEKGRPARPPDFEMYRFIKLVWTIFTMTTGTDETSYPAPKDRESGEFYGKFYEFAGACIEPVDTKKNRSNQSFGDTILRALGRKSKPKPKS
jgi:hypothetical protein